MWLESHGNLARHPKTRRLMQRMGWTLPTTIGNLHLLWYWALEYAPTGDLTKFQPDELTHDLDLGEGTPEQFLDAMIYAGFIDRREDNVLQLHDWPDYTAKSLRPRFRRDPDRWRQVLTTYNRPIPPQRQRRASFQSQPAPQSPPAETGNDRNSVAPPQREPARDIVQNDADVVADNSSTDQAIVTTEQQMANMRRLKAEIPRSLSLVPGFVELWWPRLLDMYEKRGIPLDPNQRHELLARLCMRPNSSVRLLKHCVENRLECKWEHLADGSS